MPLEDAIFLHLYPTNAKQNEIGQNFINEDLTMYSELAGLAVPLTERYGVESYNVCYFICLFGFMMSQIAMVSLKWPM